MMKQKIDKANKGLKTIKIKGKDYVQVHERVKAFRREFPSWSLTTDVIHIEDGFVAMRGIVADEDGRILADGIAYEMESNSGVNATSYWENCQTSAWGRAIGNLGIGIETAIGSADEVANAILKQEELATEQNLKSFKKLCETLGQDPNEIIKRAGWKKGPVTNEQHGKALLILKEIEENEVH